MELTEKQQEILDDFVESQRIEKGYDEFEIHETPSFRNNKFGLGFDDLPKNIWEELVKINDTETLHQDVERYLGDRSWKVRYGIEA